MHGLTLTMAALALGGMANARDFQRRNGAAPMPDYHQTTAAAPYTHTTAAADYEAPYTTNVHNTYTTPAPYHSTAPVYTSAQGGYTSAHNSYAAPSAPSYQQGGSYQGGNQYNQYTTSTMTYTRTSTIGYGKVTTDVYYSTTVCPVTPVYKTETPMATYPANTGYPVVSTAKQQPSYPVAPPANTYPVGYGTAAPSPTTASPKVIVTAAAGRVERGLEMAGAAVAMVAAAALF